MVKARIGRRLLALLIDLIIVFTLTTIIATLGNMAFKVSAPEDVEFRGSLVEKEKLVDKLDDDADLRNLSREHIEENLSTYIIRYDKEEWLDYLDDAELSPNFPNIFLNYYESCIEYNKAYTRYMANFLIISAFSFLVVFVLYFDVLGYYYSKQTFGRQICKIKVVKTDGSKPSFYILIVRDVIGFALFNLLNICMFVPLIVNTLNMMGKDQTSLADNMTKTMVVKSE